MSKRIAVVSGGIGGLGTEICKSLARAGRRVVALDLGARAERIEQFGELTRDFDIRFEAADVADFDDCGAAIERILRADGAIDILVNAAGITRDGSLRKMPKRAWDEVLSVNLDGVFHGCRAVAPVMIERMVGSAIRLSTSRAISGSTSAGRRPLTR